MSAKVPKEMKPANRKEDLSKKKFTNGHKFFNAQESKAFQQLLAVEEEKRTRFNSCKDMLKVPRNPLNGDFTPRDQTGKRVTDPNNFKDVYGGVLLFDPEKDNTSTVVRKVNPKDTLISSCAKIGVQNGKHEILGNDPAFWPAGTDTFGAPGGGISTSHFDTVKLQDDNSRSKNEEKKKRLDYIHREKAKRQQADLQREIAVLQKQQEQRQKQINYLESTYKLN